MSYYKSQPGGLYGGFIGNVAAGVDLPFGGGGSYKTIQQQFRPGSTDRQRLPDPIRVFPQNEPGREGAINVRFEQAQLMPGMQPMGNAGALGGPMQMGPRFGPRPLNIDINAVDDRLESVGGSANIQLDRDQLLRLGGTYNPAYTDELGIANPQGYELFGEYTTPGVGIRATYRNTRGNPSAIGVPGGFPGQVQAGFKGRF